MFFTAGRAQGYIYVYIYVYTETALRAALCYNRWLVLSCVRRSVPPDGLAGKLSDLDVSSSPARQIT